MAILGRFAPGKTCGAVNPDGIEAPDGSARKAQVAAFAAMETFYLQFCINVAKQNCVAAGPTG